MPPRASDAIRYRPATAEELAADADFAALYAASFPADEREPLPVIWASVRRGHGLVLRAQADGRTIGLATLHLVRQPPVAFLVYVAVDPAWRRHGVGAALIEHAWRDAMQRAPLAALVWEIDGPTLTTDAIEHARRLGRLEFFRRLGGEVLSETYRQPPVNGPAPVPMWLMGRRAPACEFPPARDITAGIYFEKYGAANGLDRNLLTQLLASETPSRRATKVDPMVARRHE